MINCTAHDVNIIDSRQVTVWDSELTSNDCTIVIKLPLEVTIFKVSKQLRLE